MLIFICKNQAFLHFSYKSWYITGFKTKTNPIQIKTSIPWNNEPAPFDFLSAIFWEKYFWEQKKNIFEGEKTVFWKKNEKKNFGKNLKKKLFFDFFNIMITYFDSNRLFSDKITILSYKTIFGPAFGLISENLVE